MAKEKKMVREGSMVGFGRWSVLKVVVEVGSAGSQASQVCYERGRCRGFWAVVVLSLLLRMVDKLALGKKSSMAGTASFMCSRRP